MNEPTTLSSNDRLLFDLAGIDLTGVIADATEIERVNPHKGDMRQLDRVVWWNGERTMAIGNKFVRDDEFWVPGHIPGRPLYPGVLQIEAAAQLCCFVHGSRFPDAPFLGFTRVKHFTFRGQVIPGDTLLLLSKEVKGNSRRFVSDLQGYVGQKLVFEGSITGMQI